MKRKTRRWVFIDSLSRLQKQLLKQEAQLESMRREADKLFDSVMSGNHFDTDAADAYNELCEQIKSAETRITQNNKLLPESMRVNTGSEELAKDGLTAENALFNVPITEDLFSDSSIQLLNGKATDFTIEPGMEDSILVRWMYQNIIDFCDYDGDKKDFIRDFNSGKICGKNRQIKILRKRYYA